MARERLQTATAGRAVSRAGLFATGSRQLALPIEARGLSEVTIASGSLVITPDYDVLAWLCTRWKQRPTESGWMRPSLYEIGSDLYDKAPSGEDYRTLRKSLSRLATVSLTLFGIDGITGEHDRDAFIEGEGLLVWTGSTALALDGRYRPGVQLAGWLRRAIDEGAPVRLHWRTLRSFSKNQKLAKRLWIYLHAERWKRTGDGSAEATWIACGDRLFAALGMDYAQPRQARAALKRACETIRHKDARFAAGQLDIVKVGSSWRVQARRPTWECWRELKAEHEEARRAIAVSLAKAA
ncbi:MAG: hypothetical protein M3Z33_02975 [Actinomycetota bacterium]|nr:hypothetical protein [Actinomycetota bacterium]